MESEPEKLRWVMYFTEAVKGLVLNPTNGQIIAQFIGSDESDNWVGHKVVLYDEPNISFGGKLVGGIRVRAPRVQGQPPAATKPLFKQQGLARPPAPSAATAAPLPPAEDYEPHRLEGQDESDSPF